MTFNAKTIIILFAVIIAANMATEFLRPYLPTGSTTAPTV